MAWEIRGKRAVYYTAKRVDGRVQKTYLGFGERAEAAAREDQKRRDLARKAHADLCELTNETQLALSLMHELNAGTDLLTQAVLLTAGFHQHRGNWRKRRGARNHGR